MDTWVLDVLACPHDGGRLAIVRGGHTRGGGLEVGELACARCHVRYPVVGGVPLAVPDPHAWVAAYREAVLAALSEVGRATRRAVELIGEYAAGAHAVEARRFADDWVPTELVPQPADAITIVDHGSPARAFAHFCELARGAGPQEVLMQLLADHAWGTTVEFGSGAGTLARAIRRRARRYLACDLSLRAVFRTLDAARRTRGSLLAGAVVDADCVQLRAATCQTIVAAQLVDLLDRPGDLLHAAASALADGGALAVITPAPDLGLGAGDDALARAIEETGLRIVAERDGVPWIREHGPRHFEVYFAAAMVASK